MRPRRWVPTGRGCRSRDFEFGETCGLCPGSLPKEMNWSQDWADGGISLTKSNQSKSKQRSAVQHVHCSTARSSRPAAHGSWQGGGGRGGGRAKGRAPEDPCAAAVGIDRCPHLFPHFSFDVYQLGPLFAQNCPNIHDIVERRLPVSLQSPPLPLPFPQRGSSAVSSSSTMQWPCCPPVPAALGPSLSLSVCHKSQSHRPISPIRLMIPCRRCPMGPSRARLGPAHLLHEIPNIRY